MDTVFRAEDVWKRYGATLALRGVSLEIGRGLSVLVGPNGSGKSTLLRILTGLAKPDKGVVESLGLDPWRHRDKLLKRIGVVFEGMQLPWWLSGRDALELLASKRSPGSFDSVKEYAEILGVTEYWSRSIRGYSMGMRKKLMLAAGFGLAEEALVLDEPYTLLDAHSVRLVDEIVAKISQSIPVVVATHVITTRIMMANKAIMLIDGSVAATFPEKGPSRGYICRVNDKLRFLQSIGRPETANALSYLVFDQDEMRTIINITDIASVEGVGDCLPGIIELLGMEKYIRGARSKKNKQ